MPADGGRGPVPEQGERVSKPILLWVDCTAGMPESQLRVRCASHFEVAQAEGVEQARAAIERVKPSVLCFDFDYPDQDRLLAMQATKHAHARLPILMLTLQHSESLAVWAFRARVWNYLVKPVSPEEFSDNLNALANLGNRASPPRTAQLLSAAVPSELPVLPIAPEVARLQPALQYVTRHYHERVSATAAARHSGLTRFDFSRRFRAAFGMTFRDYLLRVRITEARRLLTEGADSVTAVAYSVGFNDGSHFARCFRRLTGMLPSAYRSGWSRLQIDSLQSGSPPYLGLRRRASDRGPAGPTRP
jgi:AraC-like DNA-binding protein/ActR/RegA family two-component response regulator